MRLEMMMIYGTESKKALSSTGNAILGKKKRIKYDWISSKTLDIVEKKRKSKLNIERVKIQKEIEKSCVNDRETWWKSKADEMETFSKRNDLRNLFSTIKSLTKKSSSASSSVVDKSGKPIHGLQKSLSRWAEYFRDLFNHGEPDNLDSDLDCLVESSEETVEILQTPPTLAEVQSILKKLKSNNAPGLDNISAEMLKYGGL